MYRHECQTPLFFGEFSVSFSPWKRLRFKCVLYNKNFVARTEKDNSLSERNYFVVKNPIRIEGPFVEITDRPGLGVEVDWDVVEKHRL